MLQVPHAASGSAGIPFQVRSLQSRWAGSAGRTSSGSAAGMGACPGWGGEGLIPRSPSAFRIPTPEARFLCRHPLLQPQSGRLRLGADGSPLPVSAPAPAERPRSGPSPARPAHPADPAGRRAPSRRQAPPLTSPTGAPPRRAALHTWRSPRPCTLIGREAAAWGAGPGPAGAGKEGGCRPARGEAGADPDVHSWAPGEVEAPGPAAGERAADTGTRTATDAATMVKARRHPPPAPGPSWNSRSPLPPPPTPGP